MMHILMFAPFFAPIETSESLCNSKLALAFLDEGVELEVISANGEAYYGADWTPLWKPLQRITHHVTYAHGSRLSRAFDLLASASFMHHPIQGVRWARRAFERAKTLHRRRPFDVVLSRSPSESAHLPAMQFAQKYHLPWIANWNDPGGGKMPPPYGYGPTASDGFFHDRYLRTVALKADLHTFPSERQRRYMTGYLGGGSESRSAVVPHVALPPMSFDQPPRDGVFRLCHAGNLSQERSPETFFKGFKRFLEDVALQNQCVLEVIGIENVGLLGLAEHIGVLSNLQFIGKRNFLDTVHRLARNDVLIVLEAPCEEGIFLPGKFVDYTHVGRPILAVSPREGTVRDIITAHGGGIAADCRSPEAIAGALKQLYHSWNQGKLDEEYGSHRLYERFSPATIINLYRNLFRQLGLSA